MRINVRGIPISMYEVVGEGSQTGLFLHGVGGTAKMWAYQMRALKSFGRMISVDIPGFVGDKFPAGITSLSQYVEIMTGVLDVCGVDKAVWIGNSLGGRISIETALYVPERVTGLALLCTAGVYLGAEREHMPLDLSKEEFDKAVFFQPERFAGVQTEESKRQNLEGRRRYEELADCTDLMNFRDRLSEIRVPTHVIWGRYDLVTKVQIGEYIAAHVNDASLLILEEAAHVPQVEQPQAVTAELRTLFERLAK